VCGAIKPYHRHHHRVRRHHRAPPPRGIVPAPPSLHDRPPAPLVCGGESMRGQHSDIFAVISVNCRGNWVTTLAGAGRSREGATISTPCARFGSIDRVSRVILCGSCF
jgi:hypothetical protein